MSPPAVPSAREIRHALAAYARPDTTRGVMLFTVDMASYLALVALVLVLPWWPVQLLAGVLAGVKIANLVTLAHDAAHGSLTRSPHLNRVLAIAGFTPALFNYRLWPHDHHILHHRRTNEDHPDSYTSTGFWTADRWVSHGGKPSMAYLQ